MKRTEYHDICYQTEYHDLLLPLLPGPLWPGVFVFVRVPCMSQIDLFVNYLYSVGIFDIM